MYEWQWIRSGYTRIDLLSRDGNRVGLIRPVLTLSIRGRFGSEIFKFGTGSKIYHSTCVWYKLGLDFGPGFYKLVKRNQTLTNPTRPVLLHQSRVWFGATDHKPRGAFGMVCVIYINWAGFSA